jgi:hypothetical protein
MESPLYAMTFYDTMGYYVFGVVAMRCYGKNLNLLMAGDRHVDRVTSMPVCATFMLRADVQGEVLHVVSL